MFTGIIEGQGTIRRLQSNGPGRRLAVEAHYDLNQTKIGDSIAVNGACLTVVNLQGRRFEADVAPETLRQSALGQLHSGDTVNLERALRFSDRLDGHLVTGHIDGTGTIQSRQSEANAVIVTVGVPPVIGSMLVVKGSVAVDGISLTVNTCQTNRFTVSIVPHTARMTTLGHKQTGQPVNLETDIIGKYVQHFLHNGLAGESAAPPESVINREFLAKAGF